MKGDKTMKTFNVNLGTMTLVNGRLTVENNIVGDFIVIMDGDVLDVNTVESELNLLDIDTLSDEYINSFNNARFIDDLDDESNEVLHFNTIQDAINMICDLEFYRDGAWETYTIQDTNTLSFVLTHTID